MSKKPIYQYLNEIDNLLNNRDMVKWAENFDKGQHGAKAAATHIRVSLAAVMKAAKALRAEIQERKNKL